MTNPSEILSSPEHKEAIAAALQQPTVEVRCRCGAAARMPQAYAQYVSILHSCAACRP